jgi:hypothetical protein
VLSLLFQVTKEAAAAVILLKNRVLVGSNGGKRKRNLGTMAEMEEKTMM